MNWITKKGETTVKEICTVPLSIGNLYQDQIVCDVLDMDVCHLFLGRPWLYGNKTLHNGRENTYEFSWMGKKVILLPLSKQTTTGKVPPSSKNNFFCYLGVKISYTQKNNLP